MSLLVAKTLALGAAQAFLAVVSAGKNGDGYTAAARVAMTTAAIAAAGAALGGIVGVSSLA